MAKIHETIDGKGDTPEVEQMAEKLSSPTRQRVRRRPLGPAARTLVDPLADAANRPTTQSNSSPRSPPSPLRSFA